MKLYTHYNHWYFVINGKATPVFEGVQGGRSALQAFEKRGFGCVDLAEAERLMAAQSLPENSGWYPHVFGDSMFR